MNISANISTMNLHSSYTALTVGNKGDKSTPDFSIEMREQSFTYSYVSFELQSGTAEDKFLKDYEAFQSFLDEIGYEGGAIASLSPEEAEELVSDDGFFGIEKTAERIANFVLNGAGDNEELLRAGRQGILQGFDEAEAVWGGKLPDISYKTIEKAVEIIDMAMHDMGYAILEEEA